MSNKKPTGGQNTQFKAKWVDAQGETVDCKTIRIPVYLADKVMVYAQQLHVEEMAKQKLEQCKQFADDFKESA